MAYVGVKAMRNTMRNVQPLILNSNSAPALIETAKFFVAARATEFSRPRQRRNDAVSSLMYFSLAVTFAPPHRALYSELYRSGAIILFRGRKGPIRDVSRAGLEALACRERWPGACGP